MGRIGEAITCIEEYERDYTDIDDFKIRVDASYARGCLALSEGDIEEAERHFNTALDIAHKNNSVGNAALSLQSIGMIRLKQGNTGEAEDYLRRSCEALNESEYARPYLPDAEYYLMAGNSEEAVSYARKAYARAEAAGNSKAMIRSKEILEELGAE